MSLDITLTEVKQVEVYSANITHNLVPMAESAGLYLPLWHPEYMQIYLAGELVFWLEEGIEVLKSDPDYFKEMNPKNGWGSYDTFVPWLENLLANCKEHPTAKIDSLC